VREGVIATLVAADPADPQHGRLKANAERLRAARDANGKPFEVVEIAHPAKRVEHGNRLALSYINFYIANGAVIAPIFDDPADAPAIETLRGLFPERRVIPLPGIEVVRGGGCFHCITQQVPRT
jgi:agmatine deiminase